MSLAECFSLQIPPCQLLSFMLRLLLACVCGAAIGFERGRRFKGAGIRTHIIVCCGAALLTIVSKYGFADLITANGGALSDSVRIDPARVAAQIVSGISFLGAGVIFKNGSTVKGLTTAACLWVTAGIGMAVGTGMLLVGMFATLLVAGMLVLLHKHAVGADAYATNRLHFTVKNGFEFNRSLTKQMELWDATIAESKIDRRKDGITEYDITIRRRVELTYDEVKAFMDQHEEIISASNSFTR